MNSRLRAAGNGLRYLVLAAVALTVLLPILLLTSGAFQSLDQLYRASTLVPWPLHLENFQQVWTDGEFYRYFENSLLYSVIAVPASVLISSLAAFAFARRRFRGRGLLQGVVLGVLLFPVAALFVPLYLTLLQLHLADTRLGYLLPVIAGTLPLNIFVLQRFFSVIPIEIEEAARIDGAGDLRIFWQIALPLVRPGLAAAGVLTLVYVWNEFQLALVIFRDPMLMPIQDGLVQFESGERPAQQLMLAASALALVPVVIAYVTAQRWITRGIMEGAVRG